MGACGRPWREALLDDWGRVIADANSAEVKDLLQRLVTKVVVRDRESAEV